MKSWWLLKQSLILCCQELSSPTTSSRQLHASTLVSDQCTPGVVTRCLPDQVNINNLMVPKQTKYPLKRDYSLHPPNSLSLPVSTIPVSSSVPVSTIPVASYSIPVSSYSIGCTSPAMNGNKVGPWPLDNEETPNDDDEETSLINNAIR